MSSQMGCAAHLVTSATRQALQQCTCSHTNSLTSCQHFTLAQVKKPAKQSQPDEAGTQTDQPLDTVFVSSEVGPWSKTGGLGDVVGSLPIALANRGHRVMVVAPR